MELRQLRYLREVARLGSFRRAAERLSITQPALTKSVRALEAALGVRLLERRARGAVPTPFGDILIGCADNVTVDIERALAEIARLSGQSSGVVRVGGMTTVMQWLLPAVLKDLLRNSPDLRIVTTVSLLTEVVTQIAEGEIDVGLCTLFPWHRSAAIRGEKLIRDEIAIVADARHPLAGRTGLSLAALAPYRWALPGEGDGWRRRLFEIHRETGLTDPIVAVETGSAALMARLVENTELLSFLPRKLLHADDMFRRLVALGVKTHLPDFEVYVAYRKANAALPSTKRFVAALKARYGGEAERAR